MAISVNDGTAKWQLIKYSEADTLGGLTASEIKSQAISGKNVQVKGQHGLVKLSTNGTKTYTIPVPSGYNRSQCAYVISEEYSGDNEWTTIRTTLANVNQSTGVISPTIGGANPNMYGSNISVDFIVFAAK